MIYEVRTLDIGSKLYKASGYPIIDMKEIVEYQRKNPPKPENKHWAYSLYFSNNEEVCKGYLCDFKTSYLIEITLNSPINYIFTDDPAFATSSLTDKYMREKVVPATEEVIKKHSHNAAMAALHYPEQPFMRMLGERGYGFSDIMNCSEEQEFIIPHTLLLKCSFVQKYEGPFERPFYFIQ